MRGINRWNARWLAGIGLILCAGCNAMNGQVNNQAGTNLYKQGNYTGARDEFQRAVANDPDNADYLHNLATATKKQGDAAQAERVYRQAIAVRPDHQPSYHALAQLLKEEGRHQDAVDVLQSWTDTQPYNAEAHVEMAWMKRDAGDLLGAEQELLSALRAKPNDHIVTAQLGQLYQDTNQPDRAAAMYRRSLHSHWHQPAVQSRLASLERAHPGQHAVPVQAFAPQPAYGPQPYLAYSSQAALPGGGYPLPTYSHALAQLPQFSPSATYAATTAGPASVAARPQPAPMAAVPGPRGVDPAHADVQISSDIPVVQPH